jgi:NADPH:quinone reductase-like Zn-dependent oxidoreductase
VLIHAAAGGVGRSPSAGGRRRRNVIGTASPPNHDYLRDLGATPVSYGDGLPTAFCESRPTASTALTAQAGRSPEASLALVPDSTGKRAIAYSPAVLELGGAPTQRTALDCHCDSWSTCIRPAASSPIQQGFH